VRAWLASKPARWLAGIDHVVIDPYQPYATAIAAELPDARLVVHFHVIRLANAALDGVRRRTQQVSLGHRGRKTDPLYRIRRRLLAAHDRLDPTRFARMLAWLDAGDPDGGVGAAYLAKGLLRETYLADDVFDARRRLVAFYQHCQASDVPELERLARTIAHWERSILRWHPTRLTNAATEGTNLVIKNIKPSASGSGTSRTIDSRFSYAAVPHGRLPRSHQYGPANHASSRRAGLQIWPMGQKSPRWRRRHRARRMADDADVWPMTPTSC
jgi:transposase